MDIDDDKIDTKLNKGKNIVFSSSSAEPKSVPWVEKFRPQSLSDVAAHRDIVETSMFLDLCILLVISDRAMYIIDVFGQKLIGLQVVIGCRICCFMDLLELERLLQFLLLLGSYMGLRCTIWF